MDLRSKSVDELRESPETKQDVMPPAEERLDFDDDGTLRGEMQFTEVVCLIGVRFDGLKSETYLDNGS